MTERPTPDLAIVETRVYRGANVWSYDKAIHLVVDLGSLEQFPTNTIPGFTDDLLEMLPGPARALLLARAPRRLRRAAPRGHLARPRRRARRARAAAGRRATTSAAARPAAGQGRAGPLQRHLRLRRRAGRPRRRRLAVRLVNHLVEADPEFDWDAASSRPSSCRAERTAFGPSTQAIIDEAVSRDIPWIRLNQHSLVQLGQGVHAKRIRATMTSETSSIAVDIASDKDLTTRLLGAAGLPVPKQESVRTRRPGGARRPSGSATRSWSSRSTATTAAASASTCRTRTTCARPSRSPRSSRGAAR